MTARLSGKPCRQRASNPASLRAGVAKSHSPTTSSSTVSATRLRTFSPNSKAGAASQPVTTAVRIPSSQAYASPQPSSSGFDLMSPEPRGERFNLIKIQTSRFNDDEFKASVVVFDNLRQHGEVCDPLRRNDPIFSKMRAQGIDKLVFADGRTSPASGKSWNRPAGLQSSEPRTASTDEWRLQRSPRRRLHHSSAV